MRPTIRSASRRPAVPLAVRALAILAIPVLLAACAGSTASLSAGEAGGGAPAAAPDVAPSVGGATGYEVGRTGAVAADGSVTQVDAYGNAVTDPQVIKTGSMTIEVEDIESAVADGRTAVVALGGYVSGTSAYDQGTSKWASITYRIPSARWDEALAALRKIGTKVIDEQTGAIEVTAQVVDLDARIRNLKATETQLLEIMTKATRIADVLAVQVQLTDVRGQIEQLTAQLKQLQDQAALGTLTVSYQVPVAAIEQVSQDWDLGQQVDAAIAALIGLGQFTVSLAIWLVLVGLPALLAVAVVFLLVRALAGRLGIALPRRRSQLPPA